MRWWVHELIQAGEIILLLSWTFWVILSICLHELGHGWAALWQGDDTPRRLGRMTMNPLVHMGGFSLLAFALIGIAWGVMPTNPFNYRSGRRGRIYVAAAGPAVNLVLAFLALTAAAIWSLIATDGMLDPQSDVTIFLITGGWLNILLALFNLMPIPPLDGSAILSGISARFESLFQSQQAQLFGLFLIIALIVTGMVGIIFRGVQTIAAGYVDLLLGFF